MDNLQIPLNLTLLEVNTILSNLGKGPFEQVFALIQKIQAQARPPIAHAEAQAQAAIDKQQTAAAVAEAVKDLATPTAEAVAKVPPKNRAARRRAKAMNGAANDQPAQ